MNRTTVNAELRRQFFPVLVAEGLIRSGDIARRRVGDAVAHVVEIQHRPRNAVFQVNLGAHLLTLDDVPVRAPVPFEGIREYDCAWRRSVISGFRNASDAEFAYGATAEEAAESVAFLVSEWRRQADAFFGPLTSYPADFHARAAASLGSDLHPAHLRTWARVALLLGDSELASAIVTDALPRVPERATALRADLERILVSG